MRSKIFWLITTCLLLNACARRQAPRQPDEAAQQNLRQLATTLPSGTLFRNLLDRGWHGDGIHESWMDDMRKLQVKGAMFEVHGRRLGFLGFLHPWIGRRMYFSSYAGPGAQIADPTVLQRIRDSGLEHRLETVALRRANGTVHVLDNPKFSCTRCFSQIYLVDDEWLDWDYLTLTEYAPTVTPLQEAAIVGDQIETETLLEQKKVGQDDLNAALFAAMASSWDNTGVTKLLLKHGANVNARRSDGSTPLIVAASQNDINAVRVLLEARADANLKNEDKETALSIAECTSCSETAKADFDHSPELVQALKQAGAH